MRQRDETLRALLGVVEIDGRIEAGFVHWLAATQSALAALDAAGDGEKLLGLVSADGRYRPISPTDRGASSGHWHRQARLADPNREKAVPAPRLRSARRIVPSGGDLASVGTNQVPRGLSREA